MTHQKPEDLIEINGELKTPKYKQIIYSVMELIRNGQLSKGDRLPSINRLSERHYLARDTVEKAYAELKARGILQAIPGKGNFIDNNHVDLKYRIFLLFNKLSAHKKLIYDAFVQALGEEATIDFHIYNNDYRQFERLIHENVGNYSHYVIMPHFYEDYEDILKTLNKVPTERLIVLDKMVEGLSPEVGCIYQNFRADLEQVLLANEARISNYLRVVLVFPGDSYHPKSIVDGCKAATQKMNIELVVVDSFASYDIQPKDLLIIVEENDLVEAIKITRQKQLHLGREVGILSYNETPVKEVLAEGISVISTDFVHMGKQAAQLILSNQQVQVPNPFRLILRSSF